jgi:ubiquinone/menaquinone biosynthesis C-methylase UbiE
VTGFVAEIGVNSSSISDHYQNSGLLAAIRGGIAALGKTTSTITVDDLAPVDEFHIGGRRATEELFRQLEPAPAQHLLDIGCGLGGPARFAADRYQCRVSGVDLTRDYVEAGNALCQWLGLDDRVVLHHANALSMPFADGTFSAAYMLHAGMNIEDKARLFREVAHVLQARARFAIYDVMRTGEGDLRYPLPWATVPESNAVATPEQYQDALYAAGFELLSQRSRRDFALSYFARLQSQMAAADGPGPLGMHTLMGERRQRQVPNMVANISNGLIAPFEMIAQKT